MREASTRFAWATSSMWRIIASRVSTTSDFSSTLHNEILSVGEIAAKCRRNCRSVSCSGVRRASAPMVSRGRGAVQRLLSIGGPGAADLGRAALEIESEKLVLRLSSPPEGLFTRHSSLLTRT